MVVSVTLQVPRSIPRDAGACRSKSQWLRANMGTETRFGENNTIGLTEAGRLPSSVTIAPSKDELRAMVASFDGKIVKVAAGVATTKEGKRNALVEHDARKGTNSDPRSRGVMMGALGGSRAGRGAGLVALAVHGSDRLIAR